MAQPSTEFRSNLYKLMNKSLSKSDVKDLCLELGIDFENIPENGKSGQIRELILFCERRGRFPDLLVALNELIPDVTWPTLGDSGQSQDNNAKQTSTETQPAIYYVYNGDVYFGDQLSVGNINNAQGLAIGRAAKVSINSNASSGDRSLASEFDQLLAVIAASNPDVQERANLHVESIMAELSKGESSDDDNLAGHLEDLADFLPGAKAPLLSIFNSPHMLKKTGPATRYVLRRIGEK